MNDAAFDAVFFKHYGVNPFIDTEDDNLSTFGMDVDTGSYGVMSYYVDSGHLPPPESVRVEEYLNYFDYGYGLPEGGDAFAIHLEGGLSPFGSERHSMLRVGLQAGVVDDAERAPLVLVFCIDVSGSMGGERLELVKGTVEYLVGGLGPGDRVGVVVYGDYADVLVKPVDADREGKRKVVNKVRSLVVGGSTYAAAGLEAAYRMASDDIEQGQLGQIVLMSDGVANVGLTGPDSILEDVRSELEDGVHLSTMGFGMGNYNDVLMEQLANQGDGSYHYIDALYQAERLMSRGIGGLFGVVAKDAKVQVEFNPQVVRSYRLLGYENRDVEDDRFRDDDVDAGEVMSGHSVTALYEMKLFPGVDGNLAVVRLRYHDYGGDYGVVEVSEGIDRSEFADDFGELSSGFRLAAGVAEYAEVLRGSYWAKGSDVRDVSKWMEGLREDSEYDNAWDVLEFLALVGKAAEYDGG